MNHTDVDYGMVSTIPSLCHLHTIISTRQGEKVLPPSPLSQRDTSKQCLNYLLGTLCILIIAIHGVDSIFFQLKAAFLCTGWVPFTPTVHVELADWHRLLRSLQEFPNLMIEVVPPPLTCFGTSNASNGSISCVYFGPDDHLRIWCHCRL